MARRKIGSVGLVHVYYDPDYQEYVVKPAGDKNDDAAYFTTDKKDAFDTAAEMAGARPNPLQRDVNFKKRFHIFIPRGHGGLQYGWDGVTPVTMKVTFAANAPKGSRYVYNLSSRMVNTPAFQEWYKTSDRTVSGTQREIIAQLERISAGGRATNPKRRRFHKPKLRRAFVEDDGHVFAKPDATGYLGKIKANPKRKKRRSLVPKSRPVPRWLIKAAHKSVAKQRKMKNPVRITSPKAGGKRQFRVYTRKLSGPWALTVKTNSVKHALDSAGKLETRGYRVRVTQVR